MDLNRQPGVALHHQISTLIEDMVASGRLRDGDQLPTEEELRAQYGVSRVTVQRALQSLEERGLLKRQRGRGTYVSAPLRSAPLPMPMESFLATMAERRSRSKPSVKEFGFVPAPADVATALRLEEGTPVLAGGAAAQHGRLPILHSIVHLIEDVGRRFVRADFSRLSLTELLRGPGHPLRPHRDAHARHAGRRAAGRAARRADGLGAGRRDAHRPRRGRPAFEFQRLRGPSDRFHSHVTIRG